MTIDEVIWSETDQYLSSHSFTNWDDITKAKEEVLEKIYAEFDAHNVVVNAKGKKWKYPVALTVNQTAQMACGIFNVRRIKCCESSSKDISYMLGVYVDDLSLNVLGNSYAEDKGTYVCDDTALHKMISFFNRELKANDVKIACEKLEQDAPVVSKCFDKNLIPLHNCIFNYETKQTMGFSSELVFLSKYAVDYNPLATNKQFTNKDGTVWDLDSWVKTLTDDPEVLPFLDYMILAMLLRSNQCFGRCIVLTGEQGCGGKGSLLTLWRGVLGEKTWVSKQLTDFSRPFALEDLITKQAIITDENDTDGFIKNCANLKAIITNDQLNIDRKFKSNVTFSFRGAHVTCCNKSIRMADTSDSFYRRFIFLPMTKCFTNNENTDIKKIYLQDKDVLEYALKKALESNFDALPIPSCSLDAVQESKELNNPVQTFWNEMREKFVWDVLPFGFLYDLYKSWFKKNVPSGIVSKSTVFKEELRNAVRDDTEWDCSDLKRTIRTQNKMDKPELLIYEYELREWINKNANRSDIFALCSKTPPSSCQGVLRIGTSVQKDD